MREFEPERYELNESPRYEFQLDRREFLQLAGAGLLFSVSAPPAAGAPAGSIAARLHIGDDGRVTVMTGKVEVGQGSRAQLTQAAAEELRLPCERIRLVMGDTQLTPDDGGTFGSLTTPSTVPAVRRAAATARELLLDLAAERWGVARAGLEIRDGLVREPASGRSLSYAELARLPELARRFEQAVPPDVKLTPVRDWKVLGTSAPHPNGRDIVTGAHRYPSDIVRPGMLRGKVLRPPSFGARLEAIDLAPALKMPGVVAVRDGDFVGCAAPTSFEAQQAVEAIARTASWRTAPQPSNAELFDHLRKHARREAPEVNRTRGSLEEGLASAEKVLQATYRTAYIQHAPLEPRAAVAEWEDGRLTVWTGTQTPWRVRNELAEAFRLPVERIRVIVPDTGGGFGGKHAGDAAVEAARLAKAAGKPVSVVWTRQEEFTWAYYRPAALIDIRAGLRQGRLAAWEFTNINSGAAALVSPYEIPHAREQFLASNSPLRQGSYRVLAATANNFARECFMDELAYAAGADPLEFRLAHLANDRLRHVLEAAAARFGWRERRKRRIPGRGAGLACGMEKGSVVAACVEVAADRAEGRIEVLGIWQAFECGAIQNPANLRAQVEGCIIMTLGGTLFEEIRFEGGRILNARFSRYRVPRLADVPPMEIELIDRPDLASAGAGETPMIAVPPAVANAVFDATGVRLRSLPLRGEALRGT
jgi:isoquinoline 1-oxidoreductase